MDLKIPQSYISQVVTLTDEETSLLMECVERRILKKGDVLLKEGEICRAFYLVEKGHLRTYYNKDGVPINMNFTFEGEFTANLKSFRNRHPSEVTIEAGEDTSIWFFHLTSVSEQFGNHPQILRFIRRLAISHLLASEAHSDLFKIYTPTERYRYIEKNNPRLLQRISLSQIAS